MADISITGKSGDKSISFKASAWTSGKVELGSCYGIDVVYCEALLGF